MNLTISTTTTATTTTTSSPRPPTPTATPPQHKKTLKELAAVTTTTTTTTIIITSRPKTEENISGKTGVELVLNDEHYDFEIIFSCSQTKSILKGKNKDSGKKKGRQKKQHFQFAAEDEIFLPDGTYEKKERPEVDTWESGRAPEDFYSKLFQGDSSTDDKSNTNDTVSANTKSRREKYKEKRLQARMGNGRTPRTFARPRESENSVRVAEQRRKAEQQDKRKRLQKLHDQLTLSVYNLDLEIAQKQKERDEQQARLNRIAQKIEGYRPKSWSEMELDLNPHNKEAQHIEAQKIDKENHSPVINFFNEQNGEQIVRMKVIKMNRFTKNSPRWIEFHATSKKLILYKMRNSPPQFTINVEYIIEASVIANTPNQMKLLFFAEEQKLLRHRREWRLKFDNHMLRERLYRLLRESMPTKDKIKRHVYKPRPLPVKKSVMVIVKELPVSELAEILHDHWIETKLHSGWKYGPELSDSKKTDPQMRKWSLLSKEEGRFDLDIATLTLSAIIELGYDIQNRGVVEHGGLEAVTKLIEFLAENAHESWAANKMAQGWSPGEETNAKAKTHKLLKPYIYMSHENQEADREACKNIIAGLFQMGYVVSQRDSCDNLRDRNESVLNTTG